MPLKIGANDVDKLYLGSTEILKAYLGSALVWDRGTPPPVGEDDWVMEVTVSGDLSIVLTMSDNGPYDANIDWGDGNQSSADAYNSPGWSHVYASPGTYEVRISGTVSAPWLYNISTHRPKFTALKQFGNCDFLYLGASWGGLANMVAQSTDPLKTAVLGSWEYAFFQSSIYDPDTSNWDAGTCNDMQFLFKQSGITTPNLTTWNVANVTSFKETFALTSIDTDFEHWDMTAAQDMTDMFNRAQTMSTPSVDSFVKALHDHRMGFTWSTPTVNLAWCAPPSGVYQYMNPPTTGLEYIYWLENDPEGEGFNTWTIFYAT